MTESQPNSRNVVLVAIDIAKSKHDVLISLPTGQRKRAVIQNRKQDFEELSAYLKSLSLPCIVGLEPTADYHRNLAYFLKHQGFEVRLMSSIAVARTREALHNSWDKNDPKDAQVILHLMRTGVTQYFYDPVIEGINDLQELSKTHFQVSLRATRLRHSIMNHYLPLYFPEAEKFFCTARAHWFPNLLIEFPTPSSIIRFTKEEFIARAAKQLTTKQNKSGLLSEIYEQALQSIGIPVELESHSVRMFRLVLSEQMGLCKKRDELEELAHSLLKDHPQYRILRSVPGIGPVIALTILAESGDIRRFRHERQFLKFCGFDLSTSQSGGFRGSSSISKRGNSRMRCALWLASTIATRMRENTFRQKFDRYTRSDPKNADLKRKAYTACAAKMARVIYGLLKHEQVYRSYFEVAVPGGRTRSVGPLRQSSAAHAAAALTS